MTIPKIERMNYFKGEFLHLEDFQTEQSYHLDMRRRHNLHLHNPGIIHGLDVTPGAGEVTINPGMAIDSSGREIILLETMTIPVTAAGSIAVKYKEELTQATSETGIPGKKRCQENVELADATDPDAIILSKVKNSTTSPVTLDTTFKPTYSGPAVMDDLSVEGNLHVIGDMQVDGATVINAQKMKGNVELGDEDEDTITFNGVLKTGHTSGKLKVEAPVDITGAVTTTGNVQVGNNVTLGATGTVDGRDVSVDGTKLDGHVASTANPHATTAAQVDTQGGANRIVTQINAGMGIVAEARIDPLIARVSAVTAVNDKFNSTTGHDHDGTDSKKISPFNLEGASATVTATNLNTLTGGSTTDASTLHAHNTLPANVIGNNQVKTDAAISESKILFSSPGHNHSGEAKGSLIGTAGLQDDAITLAKIDDNTRARIQKVPLMLQTLYAKNNSFYLGYLGGAAYDNNYIWLANNGSNTISKININTNAVVASIVVGKNPMGVVFAGGAIWVANYGEATVNRIDINTNAIVATIALNGPARGVAFDGTYLWVSNSSDSVSKIDITNNTVVANVVVAPGSYPAGLVKAGSYIWVANYMANTVSKIDINTNTVVTSVPVGTYPGQLAFDGSYVWVSNYMSSNLSKINTSTNAVTTPVTVSYPRAIAFINNYIWVGSNSGTAISKINTSSNAVEATITPAGGVAIISAGAYIWGAGSSNSKLSKIDPNTNAVLADIWTADLKGTAFDGTHVWVANYANHTVSKFDVTGTSTSPVATVVVGLNPYAIAFDGSYVWVTNSGSNTVSKIDINTNTVVATVPVGTTPQGIAYDGNSLTIVVANSGSNNVSRIDISKNTVVATINLAGTPAGLNPSGIACDSSYCVWVTCSGSSNNVYKISYNNVVTQVAVGTKPAGIAFDNFYIWVANTDSNTVSKIDVSSNTVVTTINIYAGANPTALVFDGSAIWVSNSGNYSLIKIDRYTNAILFSSPIINAFGTGPLTFDGVNLWLIDYAKYALRKLLV